MKASPQKSSYDVDGTQAKPNTKCQADTCKIGVCSPCLIVWGAVAIFLLVNLMMGLFR